MYQGFPTGWANEEELRSLIQSQGGVGIQPAQRVFDAWGLAKRLLMMGEAPDEITWKRWFVDDEMRGAMKVLLNPMIKKEVRNKFDGEGTMMMPVKEDKPAPPPAFDPDKTWVFGKTTP